MYPHALPIAECMDHLLRQAKLAEEAGFDGLMTSEHHGGFPGYLPNPLQMAGWLLVKPKPKSASTEPAKKDATGG